MDNITKIKEYILKKHNEITFNEEEHTYYHAGKEKNLSPVSNTLGWFKESMSFIPQDKLEAAQVRGTWVHEYLEHYINSGGKGYAPNEVEGYKDEYMPFVKNGVKYYNRLLKAGYQVLKTEVIVFNITQKLCGTVDLLMWKEEEDKITLLITDFKTGELRCSNYAQVAIYQYLLKKTLTKLRSLDKRVVIKTDLISLKSMESM